MINDEEKNLRYRAHLKNVEYLMNTVPGFRERFNAEFIKEAGGHMGTVDTIALAEKLKLELKEADNG